MSFKFKEISFVRILYCACYETRGRHDAATEKSMYSAARNTVPLHEKLSRIANSEKSRSVGQE